MTSASATTPLLAFETSGRTLGVALWGPDGLILEKRVLEGARHGQALGPVIQEVLALSRKKIGDLSALAVSLGPGSWTGLRIGLAAAKAMAWGAGRTLIGVPSFEALALAALRCQPPAGEGLLLTVRHAYSEGLYVAFWRETEQGPERLLEDSVLTAEAIPEAAAAAQARAGLDGRPVRLCGDAVCLAALQEAAAARGWQAVEGLDEIPAGCLAECAWKRLGAGQGLAAPAEIHALGPLYLRASDPELKLKRRNAG